MNRVEETEKTIEETTDIALITYKNYKFTCDFC